MTKKKTPVPRSKRLTFSAGSAIAKVARGYVMQSVSVTMQMRCVDGDWQERWKGWVEGGRFAWLQWRSISLYQAELTDRYYTVSSPKEGK